MQIRSVYLSSAMTGKLNMLAIILNHCNLIRNTVGRFGSNNHILLSALDLIYTYTMNLYVGRMLLHSYGYCLYI